MGRGKVRGCCAGAVAVAIVCVCVWVVWDGKERCGLFELKVGLKLGARTFRLRR